MTIDTLNHIFIKHKNLWEEYGSKEPYYSLINNNQYLLKNLTEENKQLFFESGGVDIEIILNILNRIGIDIKAISTCLEYGCGVGRTTVCLSRLFYHVYGIDISNFYLKLAQEYCINNNITNISYIEMSNILDLENLYNIDLIYSVLVLQHNPPPIAIKIIEKFCQILNPKGVAIFQIPTFNESYNFDLNTYMPQLPFQKIIDMHITDQQHIFNTVIANQCRIIEISKDFWTGRNDDLSQTFVIQKLSY